MRAFSIACLAALLSTISADCQTQESFPTGKPYYPHSQTGLCLLQSARQATEESVRLSRVAVDAGPRVTAQAVHDAAAKASQLEAEAVAREGHPDCHTSLKPYHYWPWPNADYDPCFSLLEGPEVPLTNRTSWAWPAWSWKRWSGYSFVNRVGKSITSLKHMVAENLREGDAKAKSVEPRRHIKPLSLFGIQTLCVVLYPVLLMMVMVALSGCMAGCAPDDGWTLAPPPYTDPVEATVGRDPLLPGAAAAAGFPVRPSAHKGDKAESSTRTGVKNGIVQARRSALERPELSRSVTGSWTLREAAHNARLRACSIDWIASTWLESPWASVCSAVPCLTLLGALGAVIASVWLCQREAFMVVMVMTSMFLLSTSAYMVSFAHFLLRDLRRNISKDPEELKGVFGEDLQHSDEVIHWIVVPNYDEDIHVLRGALDSIARSSIAKTQLCILLAMEEREKNCKAKAEQLMIEFEKEMFLLVKASYHPAGLPHDPPGKASNNAWAFKEVIELVEQYGQDPDKVVITIADADSWFHPVHFEHLSCSFLDVDPKQRQYVIWQPAIFHMRNYHRQPPPVVVSTLITSMAEGSVLSDPNSVRFPYSTYSVPFRLAAAVGGWDPQWIAEDWHMGIKCYMFTYGRAQVRSLLMPVVNYTPEGATWVETLWARWSQAKRHALGFSDVAYVFTVLPVLLRALIKEDRPRGDRLQDLCTLLLTVAKVVTRLVNTHVLVAVLPLYMFSPPLLRAMSPKGEQFILDNMAISLSYATTCITGIFMLIYARTFQGIYDTIKDHIEPSTVPIWKSLFTRDSTHMVYLILCLCLVGPLYFPAIGVATWMAAFKCLMSRYFHYEVAKKPTEMPGMHKPQLTSAA
mmetsp:Transcript_68422/g.164262  ORF Transcript_68422/g.164262 Transcript_68422/m.164262 type:complete len:862 (+) Transcript_68422:110-2695(+)